MYVCLCVRVLEMHCTVFSVHGLKHTHKLVVINQCGRTVQAPHLNNDFL